MITDVSVLYIDPRGPYPKFVADCWDETRDAKLYDGPNPVVVHPPCGPWGSLKHMCFKQDGTCAPRALEQVRKWGGVLEHPSGSSLFKTFGMPRPGDPADAFGGRTIEVCQVDWGHVARKRTWLYMVRCEPAGPMPTRREPTHWVSGGRKANRIGKKVTGGLIPDGIKACSAQQRRRTPVAFAEWLVALARTAVRP